MISVGVLSDSNIVEEAERGGNLISAGVLSDSNTVGEAERGR